MMGALANVWQAMPDLGMAAGVADTVKTLRDMNKRQMLSQVCAIGTYKHIHAHARCRAPLELHFLC